MKLLMRILSVIKNIFYFIVLPVVLSFSIFVQANTLEDKLKNCLKKTDSSSRLACYDNVVGRIDIDDVLITVDDTQQHSVKAPTTAPIVIAVASPTVTDQADEFGKEHLTKSAEDEVVSIVFVVAKIKKVLHNQWHITFENGQVWQQSDTSPMRLEVGTSVKLTHGFGSAIYLQKTGSNKRIRVKRLT